MDKIELNKCQKDKIAEICAEFGNAPGELINVLHKCQGHFGYLPEEVQREIARRLPAICTFPWPRSMESLHSTPSSPCSPRAATPSRYVWVRPAMCVEPRAYWKSSRKSLRSTWAESPQTGSSPWSACAAWEPVVWHQ